MLTQYLHDIVRHATGERVTTLHPLRSGSADTALYQVHCASGTQFALKTGSRLESEGRGLQRLAYEGIPSPQVYAQADNYLLMDWLRGTAYLPGHSDADVAEHLARLHRVAGPHCGWDEPSWLGGYRLDNAPAADWPSFLRDNRLRPLAQAALQARKLPDSLYARIESLAVELPARLPADRPFCLCHGALWTGHVLCSRRRLAGLIAPALHYGDPEMDLATFALAGQPSADFYAAYAEHGDLAPHYRERQALYQLIPLLARVLMDAEPNLTALDQRLTALGI